MILKLNVDFDMDKQTLYKKYDMLQQQLKKLQVDYEARKQMILKDLTKTEREILKKGG